MDISKKLNAIIIDKLGIDEKDIKSESTFSDLSADSLDTVELIMEIEKEFDIKIPDEETESLKTVQDTLTLIENKLKTKNNEG